MIIEFEDHHQDFLEWEIDENGVVIDSTPFQFKFWGGCQVLNKDELKVGGYVQLKTPRGQIQIKYPIKSIKEKVHE